MHNTTTPNPNPNPPTIKTIRLLADPTRLRLLNLLQQNELAVHELRDITQLPQSRTSTQLRQLQENQLLQSRRHGKQTLYRLNKNLPQPTQQLLQLTLQTAHQLPQTKTDQTNLRRTLKNRQQHKTNFPQITGRCGRNYGPGRSWQALAHLLLRALPPLHIADLGSGEGLLAELLAPRAHHIIAIDNSPKIIQYGKKKAHQNKHHNLEFRLGDITNPPIQPNTIDLAILSQALHHTPHPQKTLQATHHILRPGGQLIILDLLQHNQQQAKQLYGDHWLGFHPTQLHTWLKKTHYTHIHTATITKEPQPPHHQTILAHATKPKTTKTTTKTKPTTKPKTKNKNKKTTQPTKTN